jgi:hypothetical protein
MERPFNDAEDLPTSDPISFLDAKFSNDGWTAVEIRCGYEDDAVFRFDPPAATHAC